MDLLFQSFLDSEYSKWLPFVWIAVCSSRGLKSLDVTEMANAFTICSKYMKPKYPTIRREHLGKEPQFPAGGILWRTQTSVHRRALVIGRFLNMQKETEINWWYVQLPVYDIVTEQRVRCSAMFTDDVLFRLDVHSLTSRNCFVIHKNRQVICTYFWLRFSLSGQQSACLRF